VALVQAPFVAGRDPHQIHFVLHVPQRADRALEHRGVGQVEREAGFTQQFAALAGLGDACVGQVDVDPAGEAVLQIPRRFAVADEDELVHDCHDEK
jgi:hypothetical protein